MTGFLQIFMIYIPDTSYGPYAIPSLPLTLNLRETPYSAPTLPITISLEFEAP